MSLLLFQTAKCVVGSKPCLVFSGDLFETDSEYARLKNLFIGECNEDVLCVVLFMCMHTH